MSSSCPFPSFPPPEPAPRKRTKTYLSFGLLLVLLSTFLLLWGSQQKELLATITLNDAHFASSEGIQSLQQARDFVSEKNASKIQVTIKHSDNSSPFVFQSTLSEMGFSFEIHSSLFERSDLERITPFFHSSADQDIELAQVSVDPTAWEDFLSALDEKVSKPYREEKILWTPEEGWIYREPEIGRALNKVQANRVFENLRKRLSSHQSAHDLVFSTRTITSPQYLPGDSALRIGYQVLQEYIRTPIALQVGDTQHWLDLNSSADLLKVENYQVSLNLAPIRTFAQSVADEHYIPSATVRIVGKEEVRPNVFKALTEGSFDHGQRVNVDEVMAMIEGYLTHQVWMKQDPDGPAPDEERILHVPTHDVPVKIYSELIGSPLELLSVGFSEYSTGNNANRVHNIKTGLARLNTLMVDPGQTISFNRMTGSIDSEFRIGYAILGSKAALSLGGGICQVSTTFYRGLLNLGVPITQRQNHSWDLSYYREGGYGLDATIYPAVGLDVKAVNDFESDLFFSTYTLPDKEEAYILIYGVGDGRKVTLEPEEDYKPFYGAKTLKWTQTIEKSNGELIISDIISRYRT